MIVYENLLKKSVDVSTVQHCNRTYRLEKGDIVEHGSSASVIGN